MAGSPPVAERLGLDSFHFVNRQVIFLVPALGDADRQSFLSPRHVRRTGAAGLSSWRLALMVATLFFGAEVKGARRWIARRHLASSLRSS